MTSATMRCGSVVLMVALSLGVGRAAAQPGNSGHAPPGQPAYPTAKPALSKAAQQPPAKPTEHQPAKPRTVLVPLPQAAPKAASGKTTPSASTASEKPTEPETALAKMPAAERLKILSVLMWSGDYDSDVNGQDPLIAAIKSYQKRKKAQMTGVLTPSEQATLIAAAQRLEREFGWRVRVDPATGIRIGLPMKLMPFARDAARGTRWSSAHGTIQVETFRIKQAGLKLADVYEREKKRPAGRVVLSSTLDDDYFLLSGTQGLRNFMELAQMRDHEVRGFTLRYDQAMAGIVAPAVAPMANAFAAFPALGAPYAALTRPVEYGSGLIVNPQGDIVTALKLAGDCQVIVAAGLGNADLVAIDATKGLALLRVYGRYKAAGVPLTATGRTTAGTLTLVGVPDPRQDDGHANVVAVKVRPVAGGLELSEPAPMAGFSGAAVLAGNGKVLGMMELRHATPVDDALAAPPLRLIAAETIRDFLAAHHVAVAASEGDVRKSVVRIICVRK